MTKKTIELIESKGYTMYKAKGNEITKTYEYYFKPDILMGNNYELIVKYKDKNNEHNLIKLIKAYENGVEKIYKSYLIEDERNTNTFKKRIKEVL